MPRWSESFYLATVSHVAETIARFRFTLDEATTWNYTQGYGMWFHVGDVKEFAGNFAMPVSVVREAYELACVCVGV